MAIAPEVAPGGLIFVDHLFSPGCPPGGDAFAAYSGTDPTGAGATPTLSSEISTRMVINHILDKGTKGCCKHPLNGMSVPIYGGAVTEKGKIPEGGTPVANVVLEMPQCVGPGCKNNMSAVVSKPDGTVLGRFDSKGMACVPNCCPDEPLLVTQTSGDDFQLGPTKIPFCVCPCLDTHFHRKAGEAGAGMDRYQLQPCASGPSRAPISHKRMGLCFCPCCGPAVAVQTYTITPPSGSTKSQELFVAAAIFESIAYPYHKMKNNDGGGGGGGGGGGPAAIEMVR